MENRLQLSKVDPKQPASQKSYINSKIHEANVLIDRVKGTLLDIKNKGNIKALEEIPEVKDKNKILDPVEVVLVVPQIRYEDVNEAATSEIHRPKTRRPECIHGIENSHDIENKFKNTPECGLSNDLIEGEMTSLECLQAKLNTINEQTESDISSALSENKILNDDMKESMTSVSCHTVILQKSEEIQVHPKVTSQGTQYSCNTVNKSTQTIEEHKTMTVENTGSNEIIVTPVKLEKCSHLIVQILPQISISSSYTQSLLHYYIDPLGKSHFLSKTTAKNVGYYEIEEIGHKPTESKIAFYSKPELIPKGNKIDTSPLIEMHGSTESKIAFYSKPELIPKGNKIDMSPLIEMHGSSESCSTVEHMFALKEKILEEQKDREHMEAQEKISNRINNSDSSSCSKESTRELVYKSFQLYDNPNHHDPAYDEFQPPCMDNSIYKTYINPEGLPKTIVCEFPCPSIVTPDAINKISSASKDIPKKDALTSEPRSSLDIQKEPNSKLWDIGLYSSKETQCDVPPDSIVEEEMEQALKDTSSYEKVSFTISYSTEETIISDTYDQNKQKRNDFSPNENKSEKVKPPLDPVKKESDQIAPKPVIHSETSANKIFKNLEDKYSEAYVGKNTKRLHLNDSYNSGASSLTTDSTAAELITGLTRSKEFSKELPRSRRPKAENKDKENHKKNFNVLSVQTHGDYISNDYGLKSPHLKLSTNGRYKDEENLFSDHHYPATENLTLRRKVLRNVSKCNYLKKYILDSSKSDTVSMEGPVSEGEIKCQCSASMGEIHKCKHIKPFLIKYPVIYNNPKIDSNVTIRERRNYFDNWITYYVNKNKIFLCDSSSSSSSK